MEDNHMQSPTTITATHHIIKLLALVKSVTTPKAD